VSKGIEKILPTGMGNVFRGIREGTEGLTTRSNAPFYHEGEQVKLTPAETFYRTLSLYPSRIAEIREKQWKRSQLEEKYTGLRSDIYSKIKKFYQGPKDQAEWAGIVAEIQEYNEAAKEQNLPTITRDSINANLRRALQEPGILSDWAREYLKIRAEGGSLSQLRKEVQDYNRKQRSQGGTGVSWSKVVSRARQIRKSERKSLTIGRIK
jgi:hypothetical protein